MLGRAIPLKTTYAQALAVVRQLSPAQQARLVQALRLEREDEVDTDAKAVASRARAAGVRITAADIDREVNAVRSRRYAAGNHQ